jgi:hypothetical protein
MEGYRTHERLCHVSIDDCLAAPAAGDPRHSLPSYRGFYTTLENLRSEGNLSQHWDMIAARNTAQSAGALTEDSSGVIEGEEGDVQLSEANISKSAETTSADGSAADQQSTALLQIASRPDISFLGDEDLRARGVPLDEIASIRAKVAMPVDAEAFVWTQGDSAPPSDSAAQQPAATQSNRSLEHPALHPNLRSVLAQVRAARAQRAIMPQPARLPDGTWVSALGMALPNDARVPTNERDIFSQPLDGYKDKGWKASGADASDYFNYALTEKTWKLYCEQQQIVRNDVLSMQQMGRLQGGRR